MSDVLAEIDLLLAPISSENATGKPSRYSTEYDTLRTLRQTIEHPDQDKFKIDWDAISSSSQKILSTLSKDLQVAAWLTEAWIHTKGLKGLENGINLIRQLCNKYWDTLYPQLDDDLEYRFVPFIWIDEKMVDALLYVPITAPLQEETPDYYLFDLIDARQLERTLQRAGPKRENVIKDAESSGRPFFKDLFKSAVNTPELFYNDLIKNCEQSYKELAKLRDYLEEKSSEHSPTFKNLFTKLEEINLFAEKALEDIEQPPVTSKTPPKTAKIDPTPPPQKKQSLEDYEISELLNALIDRVQKEDAKSPIIHLLRKAKEWSKMNAGDLLMDLVSNDVNLNQLYRFLGVKGVQNNFQNRRFNPSEKRSNPNRG